MAVKVRINFPAAWDVLVRHGVVGPGALPSAAAPEAPDSWWRLAVRLVSAIQYHRIATNLEASQAADIAAAAIDALLEFSGRVCGVVPVGAAIEAADGPVAREIAKLAYEAIRNRDTTDSGAFNQLVMRKAA